jgi:heat shock protein HslJ
LNRAAIPPEPDISGSAAEPEAEEAVSAGMTSRLVGLVAAILFVLVLVGCGEPGSSMPPLTLAGTTWRAVSVAGRSPVADREPTISFDADRVRGSGGCNQFGGSYSDVDGVLAFGDLSMTLMGCSEPIGSIETAFMGTLTALKGASIDDSGRLVLDGPGGQVLLVRAG